MAITLFNPTSENFEAHYAGSKFTIPACPKEGHMVRVDDNKANHVLNQLGPRGLTSLDYGDEGEAKAQKAKDGRKRNLDFKRTQIARYNRDNEGRKARQLEYVDPPKHIKEYSEEIGVGLIAPYEVADIKNEEISQMKKDAERRDRENDELRKQVADLIKLVQENVIPKTDDQVQSELVEGLMENIKRMNRQTFEPYVKDLGQEKYGKYPVEIQVFILEKWEGFFDKNEKVFPY